MKSGIFLTVRNKATRLPNKSLLKIHGRTTIEHLIDRLKLSKKADMIILCTSTHPDDHLLIDIAKRNGIEGFQGSEDDKLSRYLQAAKKFGINFLVIVDGDDLFCDSEHMDKIIDAYQKTDADFISVEGLPFGAASHGMSIQALEEVCATKKETDTEVWGAYFTKPGRFKTVKLTADPPVHRPELRMSLDYKEDFDFFTRIFDELGSKNTFPLRAIIQLLDKKPEIVDINKHMHQVYEANIKKKIERVERDAS